MNKDELYMSRALDLAKKGLGNVSPNPMVGAVIVHNDQIIGEGWHREFGGPHAEVNAVHTVADKTVLSSSTIYVNLEPCSHYGKTPPCAELLVSQNFKKVVIGMKDVNPEVAGNGIRILREAGVEVVEGVLEEKSVFLNRRFICNQKRGRPYIILKWARTADGFIAREDGSSKWISSPESRKIVHKWRSEEDAILVGKNTALQDDPELTVRDWHGRNPLRIVVDSNAELPRSLKLFSSEVPTICYTRAFEDKDGPHEWIALGEVTIPHILDNLYHRKVGSMIVEGGTTILNSIISQNLWDEARIFEAEKRFGEGLAAPVIEQTPWKMQPFPNDHLYWYLNHQTHG